jgi:hypothetical protein
MRAARRRAGIPQIGFAKKIMIANPKAVAVCPDGKLLNSERPTVHFPP